MSLPSGEVELVETAHIDRLGLRILFGSRVPPGK
jgi:hypothetical protein